MELKHILDQVYTLPDPSYQSLAALVRPVSHAKGCILMEANRTERFIYFIEKGLVRAYATADSEEITFWFGQEGETVLSMGSYVNNSLSYESIQLLEDSRFYTIAIRDLQELYCVDIHLANWGRKLAEQELIRAEQRLITRETRSATERYTELLRMQPELLQRVPLKFIASYLGITQVSLSRIRRQS